MPSRAEYAKINIACKELGIDKYQILADRYGLESSKQLDRFQTQDLLAHFRKLGWKVKRKNTAPASPQYKDGARRKVVALWIELYQAGFVRVRSDKALQAYVKRMTGVDNLAWCSGRQVSMLIESMKQWLEREEKQ